MKESGFEFQIGRLCRPVLAVERERYPGIAFRPDYVDGTVSPQGKSQVRVHGIFSIHESDHKLTAPAEVDMSADHWTVTLHFAVLYANWGMRNPSTLFQRVTESVDIDLTAAGTLTRH